MCYSYHKASLHTWPGLVTYTVLDRTHFHPHNCLWLLQDNKGLARVLSSAIFSITSLQRFRLFCKTYINDTEFILPKWNIWSIILPGSTLLHIPSPPGVQIRGFYKQIKFTLFQISPPCARYDFLRPL